MIKYLITILIVALGPAFILNVFLEIKRRYRNKNVKAPFTEKFLRAPGEGLFRQLQDLNEEILSAQLGLVFFPLYLIFCLIIMSNSPGANHYVGTIIIISAIVIFIIYYMRKTWKLIEQRRLLRLGYVERIKPDGVPAFNPKAVRQFLAKKEKTLPQSLRTRIVHQLEQKCRDIEPKTVQIDSQ